MVQAAGALLWGLVTDPSLRGARLLQNITYTLTQFWFNLYAGYSGQRLYDDWYQSLYNIMFTSIPVMAMGLLDQDASARHCMMWAPPLCPVMLLLRCLADAVMLLLRSFPAPGHACRNPVPCMC